MHLAVVPEDRAKKVVQEMMDFVLQNRNELESECSSLKMLNEILKSQRYDSLALLDRLEREKRAAEVEQFSKFVLVLNAKKAKIAELRQQLNREISQRSSYSQSVRSTQHMDGTRASSLALPIDPMQDSFDPLDPQFDSHEVYSLSTPQFPKRKGDLILEGKIKEVVAATSKASPSKPHNLFDLHTPSSLAIGSSSLKRQNSYQLDAPRPQPRPGFSSGKRSRLDDVLAMDDDSDDDLFPLPEPKKKMKY